MPRKLTRITPVINGYAVVITQEQGINGQPGEYTGCFLQTPDSPDDGPTLLLTEAMDTYVQLTSKFPRQVPRHILNPPDDVAP